MVSFKVTLCDAETGEVCFTTSETLEVFGTSKKFEDRCANIFASFVRGLRYHDSLHLSFTIRPQDQSLILDF